MSETHDDTSTTNGSGRASEKPARGGRSAKSVLGGVLKVFAVLGIVALGLLLAANLINTTVRWNAQRIAEKGSTEDDAAKLAARENVIVIGADEGVAAGFLALRLNAETEQIYGIAIPEGAFLDVPGRGFERIGDAYASGADGVVSAISNYLTVPFGDYIVVPTAAYRNALTKQSVVGLPEASTSSSLTTRELRALSARLERIPAENIALVPLPTKPITLGDRTYLEPQKQEVADLLKTWWGVDPADTEQATRVVVYNGAGEPGIAGAAAQTLIRAGLRVVDTQNADNFNYTTTQIIVRRGDVARGEEVRRVLGVGEIRNEPSSQDVTDVVVIIGKDFQPSTNSQQEGD